MGEYYIGRPNELYHYGVKGMRWGVRKQRDLIGRQRNISDSHYKDQRHARIKKAAKIGAVVAVAGLAIYGGTKIHNKKVFEAANNYARIFYGKQFKTFNEAKSNWYSRRDMYSALKGMTDKGLERTRRKNAKEAIKLSKIQAQNAYVNNKLTGSKHRNTLHL